MFTTERAAIAAIKSTGADRIAANTVIVLAGRGPLGAGMEEVYQLTSALKYLDVGPTVALITDARFSGVSTGPCIGHVGPEALAGGPIGRLRDGDRVRVIIDTKRLTGTIDLVRTDAATGEDHPADEELARRPMREDLRGTRALPDATRLWAALQDASGGTWGGCVYDVDSIVQLLNAGKQARTFFFSRRKMMSDSRETDLTRRGFLRTAGGSLIAAPLVGAGVAGVSGAPVEAQVPDIKLPAVGQKRARWALVGLGSLAINQVMPAFAKTEKSQLTAFVSGRREKANTLATRYGVDQKHIYSYDNFDSIANDPEIDIVYIILPNSMHAEYTIRALKAGKHVLCEKPMANTPKDCEAMIAAAKAANKKLAIGYRLRHEPFNQTMIKMARDREFGPIRAHRLRSRFQHRRSETVAAAETDGRRRLDDGHRHLRAERIALSVRRGAGGSAGDELYDAERSAVCRSRGEHRLPDAIPERPAGELHVALRRRHEPFSRVRGEGVVPNWSRRSATRACGCRSIAAA